jgi:hypothetical protein
MAFEVTMQGGYGRRDKHVVPDMDSAKSKIKEQMATGKYLGYDTKPHPIMEDHPLYCATIKSEK